MPADDHRDFEDPEMLLLAVVLLGISSTSAMFYRECVENVSSFPVVCCPLYRGSMCGASLNRGNCMPVRSSRTIPDPDIHIDDRDLFPLHYYNYTCQCKGNFIGENCGQCDFNRYGDNCENLNTVVRRDIRELSEKERHQYFAQLHQCKTKIDPDYVILVSGDRFRSTAYEFQSASYYDVWCYIHNYITRQFINNTRENNILNFGHGSTAFLTFHRAYMFYLERALQRCTKDPNFTLLYYDWRSEPECSICNDDFLGGNDAHGRINKTSVFYNWRDVFDEPKSSFLPPHRDCECAIDLIPGCKFPKGRLFNLSVPEHTAMRSYIKESLEKCYICCNLSTTESTPGQSEDSTCPEEKRGWNPELQKNGETKVAELARLLRANSASGKKDTQSSWSAETKHLRYVSKV
ncbi:unnamed protein product [Ranitomeya imitator]|uniref:Tyrosinase copper-binding domain-containing protein n=1 Tax=Ranitomeya imitator TaxID=111125 RepID=A0ABN9M1Q9_9NEOB|nr:unnamed protein product [Ranitomeya imitator]